MTVTVTVPRELEGLVEELVQKGLFLAPADVFYHALYLMKDQYDLYKVKSEELRKMVMVGLEQADRGELIDGEEVFAKLQAKITEATGKAP